MSSWHIRLGEAEGLTLTSVIAACRPEEEQRLDALGDRVSDNLEE